MVFLRKRWSGQAFWDFARVRDDVPVELRLLIDRDRILTSQSRADNVLRYLRRDLGMRDDDTRNVRTPVDVERVGGAPRP